MQIHIFPITSVLQQMGTTYSYGDAQDYSLQANKLHKYFRPTFLSLKNGKVH